MGAARVRHQRGQSLVEIVVAMLVLTPLAVGLMLLGQYIHIQQSTQLAAREAAWAATMDPALASQGLPSLASEQARLREHQFASAQQAIKSNATVPSQYVDPMLTTYAGKALLQTNDLVLNTYSQTASPSIIDKAIGSIGSVVGKFGLGNSLPPNKQGLVTAQVTATSQQIVDSSGNPVAFLGTTATERFAFSAKTVLLADSWDAAGNGETLDGKAASGAYYNRTVRGVISPLVPSTWLGRFGGIINGAVNILEHIPMLNQLMGLTTPASQFELGRTAPDVVPSDKLVPYKNVP
jgi:Tfp pilus assembly protein PilV